MSHDTFKGDVKSPGTTNVDFNEPMRAALYKIRREDDVGFSVGRTEVALDVGDTRIVEKKVRLPIRWIRGFSEVQAYQPQRMMRSGLAAIELAVISNTLFRIAARRIGWRRTYRPPRTRCRP